MSDKQPEKSKAEVHVKRECALQKHKTITLLALIQDVPSFI